MEDEKQERWQMRGWSVGHGSVTLYSAMLPKELAGE